MHPGGLRCFDDRICAKGKDGACGSALPFRFLARRSEAHADGAAVTARFKCEDIGEQTRGLVGNIQAGRGAVVGQVLDIGTGVPFVVLAVDLDLGVDDRIAGHPVDRAVEDVAEACPRDGQVDTRHDRHAIVHLDGVLRPSREFERRRLRQLVALDVDLHPGEQHVHTGGGGIAGERRTDAEGAGCAIDAAVGTKACRPLQTERGVDRGYIAIGAGSVAGHLGYQRAVRTVGDVLDDDRIAAAARRITRV